jgi:arylsulfatase A-like enzyme
MTNRRLLLSFMLAAFSLTTALAASPNIVFIISDDHAWTDYGFMGHKQIETPNLDKLAARSALFSRGYVPTALCRPALATFANGMYTHQHRVTGNDPSPLSGAIEKGAKAKGKGKGKGPSPESPAYAALREKLIGNFYQHPSLPKMLAAQGYLSHQSGKWWEGEPSRAGFTHAMTRGFPNPGGRHGDDGLKIGREGMKPVFDFIDHATTDKKPFMLWYAPFMPHTPHTPPDRLFQKYKAKGIESDHVARYYAMVEWFDETCGQLIDRIEEKGLLSNTIFAYVADNGWIQDPNSQGYAPRSKQSAHEGGTRQPIMFSWPGVIQPGDRKEQLCSSIDIVPTLLAAAGAEIPKATARGSIFCPSSNRASLQLAKMSLGKPLLTMWPTSTNRRTPCSIVGSSMENGNSFSPTTASSTATPAVTHVKKNGPSFLISSLIRTRT